MTNYYLALPMPSKLNHFPQRKKINEEQMVFFSFSVVREQTQIQQCVLLFSNDGNENQLIKLNIQRESIFSCGTSVETSHITHQYKYMNVNTNISHYPHSQSSVGCLYQFTQIIVFPRIFMIFLHNYPESSRPLLPRRTR